MDSLTSYVADWFRNREFFPYFSPGGWRINAAWIEEEERRRPGFTSALREVSLQYLRSGSSEEKIKALRALATAADEHCIAPITELAANDPEPVRTEARRALRRIKYRHSSVRYLVVAIIVVAMLSAVVLAFLSQQ